MGIDIVGMVATWAIVISLYQFFGSFFVYIIRKRKELIKHDLDLTFNSIKGTLLKPGEKFIETDEKLKQFEKFNKETENTFRKINKISAPLIWFFWVVSLLLFLSAPIIIGAMGYFKNGAIVPGIISLVLLTDITTLFVLPKNIFNRTKVNKFFAIAPVVTYPTKLLNAIYRPGEVFFLAVAAFAGLLILKELGLT